MDAVNEVKGIAKESVGWSIALSVLLIVAGLIALAAPLLAGVAVTAIVAWMLVFGGVVHLWMAWHVRGAGVHVWEALVGLAYLFAGVWTLMHPLAGLYGLTVVLTVYLVLNGLFELGLAFKVRPMPGSPLLFLDAVLLLLIAVMIWWHLPTTAGWVVGALLGFGILFSGISRLMLALAAKKALA
jgi:uncharacterized membrane protein HdeD (DUF308 family)